MKKLLSGLTIPQQYVCISLEDFRRPLSVFLTGAEGDRHLDVSNTHLFIGYRPLILAIVFADGQEAVSAANIIELSFVDQELDSPEPNRACVARLQARKIRTRAVGRHTIVFYEGTHGGHRFISGFHQFINNQRERLRRDAPGNVSLPGNLHDQVRIAYSVPRIIALITISEGGLMNMFPTDLHGPCGNKYYVSSLRHGGKASQQVERTRKLLLAFMPARDFQLVYGLGKNHMRDPRPYSEFLVLSGNSATLKLPVPASALRYKELEVIDSFDRGIHRVYIYNVVGEQSLQQGNTLAHIHQYYAQWRIDQNIPTEIYLR